IAVRGEPERRSGATLKFFADGNQVARGRSLSLSRAITYGRGINYTRRYRQFSSSSLYKARDNTQKYPTYYIID
ncbi:MAG: hypothetical protein RR212_13060, partial [Bacteroidales bacterium]